MEEHIGYLTTQMEELLTHTKKIAESLELLAKRPYFVKVSTKKQYDSLREFFLDRPDQAGIPCILILDEDKEIEITNGVEN